MSAAQALVSIGDEGVLNAHVSPLRQWIPLQADVAPGQTLLVPLYEVICGNVHQLYRGMELTATTLMRLTRDAEVEIDDDADEPLSELVKEQIR